MIKIDDDFTDAAFNFGVGILTVCLIVPSVVILISTTIYSIYYVKNFSYEISEKFFIVRSGVLTKHKVTIPFSRIQNMNISQGVFDRIFGLYTVKIETAGSTMGASQSGGTGRSEGFIPALKDPSRLEQIINRLVHQYTQEVPEKIEGHIFTDNNLAFDEFIAYILAKMVEGENMKTKIKELRKKHNMTQAQLAESVGVTRQTINYLENGKYVPSLPLALKIAKQFEISVEGIFALDEENFSE
ncbi:MAG: PH domain-containing protein [archaeon]|nr:PH domain-containing protein [archaeon]